MAEYRLLSIEDDQNIASLIGRVAEEAGFKTRAVSNASRIFSEYESFSPHVIVLDIVMPGMDGFEVLNALSERNCKAQIVILSGEAVYRPMAQRLGTEQGLSILANLTKPFRINALRETFQGVKEAIALAENIHSAGSAA